MAHALCMLGILGYKHTLRICNTYWFSNATMVTRTRLNVIHTLPLLLLLNLMVRKVTTTVSTVLVTADFPQGTGLAMAVRFRYVTSAAGEGLLMSFTRENAINLHSVGESINTRNGGRGRLIDLVKEMSLYH